MAGLRPTNLSAFEPQQQRVIEDIYKHLSGGGSQGGRFGATRYIRGSGGGVFGDYFAVDKNLEEGEPDDMRENLRLTDGSADLHLDSLRIDGLVEGRIVYPDSDRKLVGSTDLTFDGTEFKTKNGNFTGTLKATGVSTFGDDIIKDNFSLTTDYSGTGWRGTSEGDFNIRNLTVRESARFRELIIDQLSVVAGSELMSIARGKIESVDTNNNTVDIEDPNGRDATRFQVNDFFWVKAVDIDNATIVDLEGQITGITNTTLTLDTTVTGGTHAGGTTDLSGLSAGDVIVQRGHPTDTDRQALIYRTVSDSDAPIEKFFDGIDSLAAFNNTANIVVEVGPTSGFFGANNILTYSQDSVGIAGADADANKLWNYDASGGLELNWTNKFLKIFEDAGTTERFELNIDNDFSDPSSIVSTIGSSPTFNTFSGGVAPGNTGEVQPTNTGDLNISDGTVVEVSVTVSAVNNVSSDNVSGEVRLEFEDSGGSFTEVDVSYFDMSGVSSASIRLSSIVTGYVDARVILVNNASSDDNVDVDSGTFSTIAGKTEVNLLGVQVASSSNIYSRFGGGTSQIGGNLKVTEDILVEGNAFKTGGGSWDTLSDGRLKNDLGKVDAGIDMLENLGRAHWYLYKKETGIKSNTKFAGFDARKAGEAKKIRRFNGKRYATFDWNTHQTVMHNVLLDHEDRIKEIEGMLLKNEP